LSLTQIRETFGDQIVVPLQNKYCVSYVEVEGIQKFLKILISNSKWSSSWHH